MAETPSTVAKTDEGVIDNADAEFAEAWKEIEADEALDPAPEDGKQGDGDDAEHATGDEPPASDGEKPEARAPGDEPPAGKPSEDADPWKDAPPHLIAARDKMMAEMAAKDRTLARAQGNESALQKRLREIEAKLPKADPAKDGEKPEEAAAKRSEALDKLVGDFPEFKALVDAMKDVEARVEAVDGKVAPVIESDNREALERAIADLQEKHPDFRSYRFADTPDIKLADWLAQQPEQVRKDNERFRGWLSKQNDGVRALAESDDIEDVSSVLTLFKAEHAASAGGKPSNDETDERRRRQLEGGREVGGKTLTLTEEAEEGSFESEWQRLERAERRRSR